MKKIVVSQFLTLDGVMEAPELWTQYQNDEEMVKDIIDNFSASSSLLFGRTTYQFFAARWPARTGELADKFNSLPKYVVSSTLQKAEWNNSTIINGNINEAIEKLKQHRNDGNKNILVLGSYKLVQALMKDNLIDEYKLYVHPLTTGNGNRLFEEGPARRTLKLINARVFPSGVIDATYRTEQIL